MDKSNEAKMNDLNKKSEGSVSNIAPKSKFREWFCRATGSVPLDMERNPVKRLGVSRSRGIWRFSLLVLVIVVIGMNLQSITRHSMVTHDSKQVLGIFDYVYSSYFFSGELPQWMAYGLHGLDARVFEISRLSAPSYLTMFAGKLLGIRDSLTLFSITLCIEQLFFLLGMYFLSGWLFREPLTRFCVCLTAVGTLTWQAQLFFNLRIFCLLPLAFYLILKLKHEGKGHWGWLTGIVCVLGPLGSTYPYLLWAFLLTVFSLTVFWGRFSLLKCMFELRASNIVSALCFLGLALLFFGSLHHSLDNSAFDSPDRDDSGNVTLKTFLTYGGNNLPDMISALVFPSKYLEGSGGHAGMADYVGLIGLFGLPLALLQRRRCRRIFSFIVLSIVVAGLSLGGILSSVIYLFPSMHLFRHIGFLTGVIKMLALILAGFGTDRLIQLIRHRNLISHPSLKFIFLLGLTLVFYVDLNIGGSDWAALCYAAHSGVNNLANFIEGRVVYTLTRAVLIFIFVCSVWSLCKSKSSSVPKKPNFSLLLLVICVAGDCLFFQRELHSNLPQREKPFEFPALKLDWPANISRNKVFDGSSADLVTSTNLPRVKRVSEIEQLGFIPADILVKYEAWTNAPGAEYQATLSCFLQWDPPQPYFRADWVAKNVFAMQNALKNGDPEDLATVCGYQGQKFRLVPTSGSINVRSDQEALSIIESRPGWAREAIVEDPQSAVKTGVDFSPIPVGEIKLGDFSANQFSLNVSNGMNQPAWLIEADAYAPGWHATVNGKSVPVIRAYAAYRAIKVYPGMNQVRFFYQNGIWSTCYEVFAILAGVGATAGLLCLFWLIAKEVAGK